FQPCRFSGLPVEKKNPFTGEVQSVTPDEPLRAAELKAVRRVLKRARAHGPDEHGRYVVELGDGGVAEVFGADLGAGCMVALRGLTPDLSQFLYDLLKAGNWVMLPVTEDAVAVTTSPGRMKGIPEDFPRVVVCNAAGELAAQRLGHVGGQGRTLPPPPLACGPPGAVPSPPSAALGGRRRSP